MSGDSGIMTERGRNSEKVTYVIQVRGRRGRKTRIAGTLRGGLLWSVSGPKPSVVVNHLLICVADLAIAVAFVFVFKSIKIDDAHICELCRSSLNGRVDARDQAVQLYPKSGGKRWSAPPPSVPGDGVALRVDLVEEGRVAGHIDLKALDRLCAASHSSSVSNMPQTDVDLLLKGAII